MLPIALPGIVTAIALSSAIDFGNSLFGLTFSIWTIIIGHATFCIVVVFNNVIARLRRTPTSLVEASMDLGADGWQTFRYVTIPAIRTALVAGALLAFGLSFDEIVVTNFTAGSTRSRSRGSSTNIRLPHSSPIVNVVALGVILVLVDPRLLRAAAGRAAAERDRDRRGRRRRHRRRALEVLAAARSAAGGCCGWPAGSPRRRSSSNCAARGLCCANSAAWMPWNSPSSQPTSCACATRISDSLGTPCIGGASDASSSLQVGGEHLLELADGALVDLAEPDPSGLVERRLAGLLEELADHARDPQELRRLSDRLLLDLLLVRDRRGVSGDLSVWGRRPSGRA